VSGITNPERLESRCSGYGISTEQFIAMLYVQDFQCGICRRNITVEGKGQSAIDHCHTSLKVRGVLCGHCNMLLGCVEEVGLDNFTGYLSRSFNVGHKPAKVPGRLPGGQRLTGPSKAKSSSQRARECRARKKAAKLAGVS